MTNEEALMLQAGDEVEFNPGSGWKPAKILNTRKENGRVRIKLTTKGPGHKMPNTYYCAIPGMLRKVNTK